MKETLDTADQEPIENLYILRLFSYTGHGTVDVRFHSMESAQREYDRALSVRNEFLNKKRNKYWVPFIPFDTTGDDGMSLSFNLFNHEILLLDLKQSTVENTKHAMLLQTLNDEAAKKYGKKATTGFSGKAG